MELDNDKKRLAALQELTEKRKEERDIKFGGGAAKKKGKSMHDTIKGSEKYKSMVYPFENLFLIFYRMNTEFL